MSIAIKNFQVSAIDFRQGGVSLVEIMVALVLSLILLAGVGNIYLGSKQIYRAQDAQSRLQENARYAIEVLTHDIRLAGYMGCQSSGTVKPGVLANSPLVVPYFSSWLPSGVILGPFISGGNNATGTPPAFANPNPALAGSLSTNVVAGTDALTVQFAEPCGGIILEGKSLSTVNPGSVSGLLDSANTCGTGTVGTPLLIADCQTAHIFRVDTGTTKNTGGGAATSALGKSYSAGSEIMRFRSYTYYIRCNNAGNCVSPSEPALYRYDNAGNSSDELTEGIENMQIVYGVDTDGDDTANEYFAANSIHAVANPKNPPDWQQVVSVRITLTVRSVGEGADRVSTAPNPSRVFNGSSLVDNRLFKTFSTTISLRNQM
ncbi:MAG: PilW family protein [Candidatus Methylumidiphilus sp.]